MQHVALERVTLDLADERAGHLAVDRELDDRRGAGDLLEELLDLAAVDGERLCFAAVSVDHSGDFASLAKLARVARADRVAGLRGE
ncbi:hypothetical protein D3C83_76870 [compost metagenome]